MRQVDVHPGEDGYWVAECPSLPGCITQGKTREEVLDNAKEAIAGYIAALEDAGGAGRSASVGIIDRKWLIDRQETDLRCCTQ